MVTSVALRLVPPPSAASGTEFSSLQTMSHCKMPARRGQTESQRDSAHQTCASVNFCSWAFHSAEIENNEVVGLLTDTLASGAEFDTPLKALWVF